MITYLSSDLFHAPAQVLVNTVNTVGVMGKGIARTFKHAYPEMFQKYRNYCESGAFDIGKLYLYKSPTKWVLNFPTKKHWRNKSKVEYIEAGVKKFNERFSELEITSIAFPALGCGNGDLDFETQVKPLMESYLNDLATDVFICLKVSNTHDRQNLGVPEAVQMLESEPLDIPFEEVWSHIASLIKQGRNFKTPTGVKRFRVSVHLDPPNLTITDSNKTTRISERELRAFWRYLHDFGLIHQDVAPQKQHVRYLFPVFAQMPFVKPVKVSKSSTGLWSNPAMGLQLIPSPM